MNPLPHPNSLETHAMFLSVRILSEFFIDRRGPNRLETSSTGASYCHQKMAETASRTDPRPLTKFPAS